MEKDLFNLSLTTVQEPSTNALQRCLKQHVSIKVRKIEERCNRWELKFGYVLGGWYCSSLDARKAVYNVKELQKAGELLGSYGNVSKLSLFVLTWNWNPNFNGDDFHLVFDYDYRNITLLFHFFLLYHFLSSGRKSRKYTRNENTLLHSL